MEAIIGRILIGLLFLAGAGQKALDPAPVTHLLVGAGLPGGLVWPALVFNAAAGLMLVAGRHTRLVARSLAVYCAATSTFHWLPEDGWQMSIFVKNWAIAGGLLVLASQSGSSGTSATRPAR